MRAVCLLVVALAVLGRAPAGHAAPFAFCGLSRTVNGFDPVRASGISCRGARREIQAIERGDRAGWACSRAVHAAYELACRRAGAEIDVLERSPVPPKRRPDGSVRLANWLFRLDGRSLVAREDDGAWVPLGRAPFCVPDAPREVLVLLRLRSLTPHGGCFAP